MSVDLSGGLAYAPPMRRRRYVTMLDPLQERYGDVMTGLLFLGALLGDLLWSASILGALGIQGQFSKYGDSYIFNSCWVGGGGPEHSLVKAMSFFVINLYFGREGSFFNALPPSPT